MSIYRPDLIRADQTIPNPGDFESNCNALRISDGRVYTLVDLTGLIVRLVELETTLRATRHAEAEALFRHQIDGEANEAPPTDGGPRHE